MSNKKLITEANSTKFAGFLLTAHNKGAGFRHSEDIEECKLNGVVTIDLCIDILTNFDGTIDEKLSFLKESKNEIIKFHAKTK
jgi:hypothetical protein